MKIILMRHGEAGLNVRSDDERELTEAGRSKVIANILKKQDEISCVSLFLSSPIKRAWQTAHLAKQTLKRDDVIEPVDWLIHESNPWQAIKELSVLKADAVMLFSHQPFSSHFVELLCGLESGAITMNTASIIAIEADPVARDLGRVLWQLS